MRTHPSRPAAPPVEVDHLTRGYGTQRGVVDLSFSLAEGEIFGFLGPNGAGKTTTIRLLLGFLRPSAGTARIFGLDCWSDTVRVKALVGFLPGEIHLYEHMTGAECLDFFAGLRGSSAPGRPALIKRLEIDVNRPIKHLSKGNRQKLGIVAAFEHDPPLLILDEPTSGLDPLMEAVFIELLREEQARGKTVLLSSHILTEVARVAGRVGIIRDGRLIAVEDVADLRAKRERQITVTLHEPIAQDRLTALPGVRLLSVDPAGLRIDLAVHGDLRPLLRLLSDLPLDDLTAGALDLESIFLRYYDQTTPTTVGVS